MPIASSARLHERGATVPYVMRSGPLGSPYWLVRDASHWESFDETDLAGYLENGSSLFLSRFEQFMQSEGQSQTRAAQELQMMLDSLIHVRSYLLETQRA